MVMTTSTMLPLGTETPPVELPDTAGKMVSNADFEDADVLLVVFMCNHCPFVKHILDAFVDLAKAYQGRGVAVVGINSNDVENYPEDHPEMMAKLAQEKHFTFPYLYDASQAVAKAYRVACTPDFFVFDRGRELAYRGQMDDSRPGNGQPVTGADLRAALDAALAGRAVSDEQRPSMGCNIKWKVGKEPDYFG